LTPWGHEENGDTLARGGDGRFLHGAVTLPESLVLGGHVRLAALVNDVGSTGGPDVAAFPMQLDLEVGVTTGSWLVVGVVGMRGRARSGAPTSTTSSASSMFEPGLASWVISREHYAMWRPDTEGPYVRGGRFAAPYGLRLADHTAYVRRYLGFNLLEEGYGLGGGWTAGSVEAHATAFVQQPHDGAVLGAAAMVEAAPGEKFIIGGSARVTGADTTRLQAGIHGKLWLEAAKLLVQAQTDVARELFDGPGDRWQLAAYVGPVVIPARGIYVGLAYQAFAEDLGVHAVLRQGVDGWLSFLPIAHVEVMVSGRAQRIGPAERALTAMLQLHYHL
jgi:hypothetical protein